VTGIYIHTYIYIYIHTHTYYCEIQGNENRTINPVESSKEGYGSKRVVLPMMMMMMMMMMIWRGEDAHFIQANKVRTISTPNVNVSLKKYFIS
jgi:hypothetical protein